MKAIIWILASNALLTGCISYTPPITGVRAWDANDEIKRALYECGYEDYPREGIMLWNELLLTRRCMESNDFMKKDYGGYSVNYACQDSDDKKLEVCSPNAIIPSRDVQKRLNNPFCKVESYKSRVECLP